MKKQPLSFSLSILLSVLLSVCLLLGALSLQACTPTDANDTAETTNAESGSLSDTGTPSETATSEPEEQTTKEPDADTGTDTDADQNGEDTRSPDGTNDDANNDTNNDANDTADNGQAEAPTEPTQTIVNTITIEGTLNNGAYAAASGLRSAVSIYCAFETTYGGNTPWNPYPTTQTYYSTGSGVLYRLEEDGSAFLLTNYHVVYDSASNTDNHISDSIYVYLYGLEKEAYAIPAVFVGGSANYDIAILRVEKSEVLKKAIASGAAAAVTVGDSDKVVPGQTTIAIGNPSSTDLGGLSVTQGIVSVDSEYITMTASDNSGEVSFRVIRTDTPVNAGNSGGGLYNDRGELVGIVNAKITTSSIENIGYAIPSNVARAIADNIIDYCYGTDCTTVMRALLGITVTSTAASTSYDSETGLLVRSEEISVYEVSAGGLGETVLQENDIIKSITIGEKTVPVTRQYHLIDAMLDVRVGEEISLQILRDGTEMTVSVTVTEDTLAAY